MTWLYGDRVGPKSVSKKNAVAGPQRRIPAAAVSAVGFFLISDGIRLGLDHASLVTVHFKRYQ
jgi:hypothetical protein